MSIWNDLKRRWKKETESPSVPQAVVTCHDSSCMFTWIAELGPEIHCPECKLNQYYIGPLSEKFTGPKYKLQG